MLLRPFLPSKALTGPHRRPFAKHALPFLRSAFHEGERALHRVLKAVPITAWS